MGELEIRPERDQLFDYMALDTLYQRYFLKKEDERPQSGHAFGMSEKEYKRLQWLLNSFSFVLNDPQKF